jgi:hypothetical protein
MKPYDELRALYTAQPMPMTWEEIVGWHLACPNAEFHKGADFVVMGRPVVKAAGAFARDLLMHFPAHLCDAWYVFAMAGNMRRAVASMPYELPWIAFERFGRPEKDLRFIATASLRRLLWVENRASGSCSATSPQRNF